MHAPRPWTLKEQLLRSRFFLIAFLAHLIVFVMISSYIVWQGIKAPAAPIETVFNPGTMEEPKPQEQPPISGGDNPSPTPAPPTTPGPAGGFDVVGTSLAHGADMPVSFPNPMAPSAVPGSDSKFKGPEFKATIEGPKAASPLDMASVAKMIELSELKFNTTGVVGGNYKVYVAHYNAPDWSANMELRRVGSEDLVFRGSIPTLLRSIETASRGAIKGNVVPIPLNIESNELFEKIPPFIFFTGHTDFVLTDREVENLRKYLLMGGAIWGDNAMAGVGSRFDLAFRREMKRVLPDLNTKMHPLPMNHPIFTGRPFPMTKLPVGMNYLQDPIEGMEIGEYLAIIYTPNNYGALMRMAFKPGGKNLPDMVDGPDKVGVTPWFLWGNRDVYYRNFEPQACQEATQLGANIVFHLLGRFRDINRLAP